VTMRLTIQKRDDFRDFQRSEAWANIYRPCTFFTVCFLRACMLGLAAVLSDCRCRYSKSSSSYLLVHDQIFLRFTLPLA
jgi:hypothetical protein